MRYSEFQVNLPLLWFDYFFYIGTNIFNVFSPYSVNQLKQKSGNNQCAACFSKYRLKMIIWGQVKVQR